MCIQQSLERHRQLNAYESDHGGTAVFGINKFSDLTPEEFKGNVSCKVLESLTAIAVLAVYFNTPFCPNDWVDFLFLLKVKIYDIPVTCGSS